MCAYKSDLLITYIVFHFNCCKTFLIRSKRLQRNLASFGSLIPMEETYESINNKKNLNIKFFISGFMRINPFAVKKTNDSNKPSMFDDFFTKGDPPSIPSMDPSRKGKIIPKTFSSNDQQQNIDLNGSSAQRIAPKNVSTKGLIMEMFQQHQSKNAAISNRHTSNKRICLQLRVANAECQVKSLNQATKLADLRSQNIKINCIGSLKYLNDKGHKVKKIANCLTQLYQIITLNNQQLMSRISTRKNKPLDFLFTSKQVVRLLQGLLFYKPNKNKVLQLLSKVMENHILGDQVKAIAQIYHLDTLKAYYVVKQVYISQKIITNRLKSFEVDVPRVKVLDRKKLEDLAGQFLKTDKINLLLIYTKYLGGDRKPSKFNICRVDEQIKILWANIHMMKSQCPEIQEMVFKLFLRYSQFEHSESYVFAQIQAMKYSFQRVNQAFQEQIVEIEIQKMLNQGNFNESKCKDHYQDLVQLLIKRQPIDYEMAIINIAKVNSLHEKWIDYFRLFVKQVEFNEGKTKQIMKAVYLYRIAKILYAKGCTLEEQVEQKLVKQIYNKCSVILGLKFLTLMSSKALKIWSLKFLLKFTEKDFQRMQQEDSEILLKVMPDQYKCGGTVEIVTELIQTTFRSYIDSQEITTLETDISSGKNLTYSYNFDQYQLQTIKYYTRAFFKFPSVQQKIQQNINNIFKTLKAQNVKIDLSLNLYNNNLVSQLRKPQLIAKHLVFLIEIEQTEKKLTFIQKWLNVIQREAMNEDFQWFSQVLNKITDGIQTNSQVLLCLDLLKRVLSLFKNPILTVQNNFKSAHSLAKKCSLLLTLSKIGQWFEVYQHFGREQLVCYKKALRQQINLIISNPLQVLDLADLCMSKKIILLNQLINHQDIELSNPHFTRCTISDLLVKYKSVSVFEMYKTVSNELKKDLGLQPLFALYHITQLQEKLAKLLIQQNGVQFICSLTNESKPNLINAQRVIKLGVVLHSYFSTSQNQQKQKLNLLFRSIQDRLFLWLRKQKMNAKLFKELFELISVSKNSAPYQYHIIYLIQAQTKGYLAQLSEIQYKKLPFYAIYILSLRLSKQSQAFQIEDEQKRKHFLREIQVFTQLEINLLRHSSLYSNTSLQYDMCCKYVSKLTKVLIQCTKQPFIYEEAINLLKKVQSALQNTDSSDRAIKKQISLISKYIQNKSDSFYDCYIPICPLQLLKCTEHKNFNQILAKTLNQLNNKQQSQLFDVQVSKILSFINNNAEFKIDVIGISVKKIDSSSFNLLFLSLIHTIISRLNPIYCWKRNNQNCIKQIIAEFRFQIDSLADLECISLTISFLKLANKIIAKGLLSSFQVSERINPITQDILQSLRQILFRWSNCTYPLLKDLHQLSLILTHYPLGTNYNKNFTLWNLVQYREKLFLIDEILKYCREVNGLFDVKKYSLIQTIIQYTSFLKLNQSQLALKQAEEKVPVINKILKGNSINLNNIVNFIQKDFSMAQLKQITWRIAQHLNCLNFQLTPFQAEYFDYFNPKIDQS